MTDDDESLVLNRAENQFWYGVAKKTGVPVDMEILRRPVIAYPSNEFGVGLLRMTDDDESLVLTRH
jgi:hypothetical protein